MLTIESSLRSLLDEAVAAGELGPGSKLPTERELVERLQASRGSIRRALDVLETEGLITRHVGRGTYLADRTPRFVAPTPPDTSPAEIMQARLALEPPLAAIAAQAATQADLDLVTSCLQAGGAATDHGDFEAWDGRLHHAIAKAGHNALLLSMFDVMNAARGLPVWGTSKRRSSTPERRQCYHGEHTVIVEALHDRDPAGASDAMRSHLRTVSANLLDHH
ncbi:FadR/GntR family transcriptional regulator [Granulicoccus phenolivorans]|uniref:FadR/GntR family transcriptional regulator n=1 Tax=Granulicoccus phenolivorans TaxID=266854 RepID=UPI000401D27E|nr:FCD domain-containing protein [Granulicoccus phenolivorans]